MLRSTRPARAEEDGFSATSRPFHWVAAFGFLLLASVALGQEPAQPLKPPDRSSPRATLKTFLDSADAVGAFVAREYMASPTRAEFRRLFSMLEAAAGCLDLSEVPPAVRSEVGLTTVTALYETLSRIALPPFDEIPGADPPGAAVTTNAPRWVIPNTEIALVRAQTGPHSGEYLFSANAVARAGGFYQHVRGLPYTRPVPLEGLYELRVVGGGWLIPHSWIRAAPGWLRAPLGGQSVWKWATLAILLGLFSILLRWAHRLSLRGSSERPFRQALARLTLPAFILAATPALAYLALVQINLVGGAANAIKLAAAAVMSLAGAWVAWRFAPVVAERIIAMPHIAPESVDAHLIRISSRLLGMVAGAGLLFLGAEGVGIPVYGIVAGLGIGGLAIALAAQPTIENLIGSLSLFADKPIRVGEFCRYGPDIGTVEAIGIRSTRIRGLDRTLTTIPNATLSKMPIVNFTERDRTLIKTTIAVRYETTPEQLRYLLAKLREMLLAHPRVDPDAARVRFIGFGSSSLEIEVFAYVSTRDMGEFLGIQEDVFLRVMDIITQSGTRLAPPSQILYLARDGGLDTGRAQAAEAQVRQWQDEGRLPFPNFSPEQMRQLRGSLVYPPQGSTEAPAARADPGTHSPAHRSSPRRDA